MGDEQWKQVCLNTIQKNGWTLCDWNKVCLPLQEFIDGYCGAKEKAPGTPVPQIQDGKVCYCCCSCFSQDTPIMISEGVFAPIQDISTGDSILAAGPDLKWEPTTVTFRDSIGPNLTFNFMYILQYTYPVGDEQARTMIVTTDHLFLMEDGKLRAVQTLVAGDRLRRADGNISEVLFALRGSYVGSLHSMSLGEFTGDLKGHLVNSNGIVSSDYAVQLAYASDALDSKLISERPTNEVFSLRSNAAAVAFVNDRSLWPSGFVADAIDSQFNIPAGAHRFLTQEQAEDVLKNGKFSTPANLVALSQAEYLYSVYGVLGPDLLFLNDWNNELPNAYSWVAAGQRIVVLTGGMLRLYGLSTEGLALILAHMVATQSGSECVGEADYEATFDYFRTFWPDTLYGVMIPPALTQIQALFDLVNPDNRGGEPQCYNPSLECRMQAFSNGVSMMPVPDCALPEKEFGVESARANKVRNRVTVTFSGAANPPSAGTAENYTIQSLDPRIGGVLVEAAKLRVPVDKIVDLTVSGMKRGKYRLTVANVLSATDQPLTPDKTTADFEA